MQKTRLPQMTLLTYRPPAVDGRNPAPPGIYKTQKIMGFQLPFPQLVLFRRISKNHRLSTNPIGCNKDLYGNSNGPIFFCGNSTLPRGHVNRVTLQLAAVWHQGLGWGRLDGWSIEETGTRTPTGLEGFQQSVWLVIKKKLMFVMKCLKLKCLLCIFLWKRWWFQQQIQTLWTTPIFSSKKEHKKNISIFLIIFIQQFVKVSIHPLVFLLKNWLTNLTPQQKDMGHYITNPKNKWNPSKLPEVCIVWFPQNVSHFFMTPTKNL